MLLSLVQLDALDRIAVKGQRCNAHLKEYLMTSDDQGWRLKQREGFAFGNYRIPLNTRVNLPTYLEPERPL